MTPVSVAFRWAMLCTKSELRFRQFSFNHRTRNLRSVKILRLISYPLYQHAIVPFEFPRQVGWLFPLFTFNNVPCKGNTLLRLAAHDLEHIVLGGVHRAAVNQRGTFGKCLHHFLLLLGGLGHHVVVLHFRRGQMELIGGLDVGHFPEQVHQLGKVEELAEPCSRSVSSSFGGKLQSCDSLPEPAGPTVEVGHVQLLQAVILKIPLHGMR